MERLREKTVNSVCQNESMDTLIHDFVYANTDAAPFPDEVKAARKKPENRERQQGAMGDRKEAGGSGEEEGGGSGGARGVV